ncbi:ATP-binding cassette domain-containing protein [Methanolobus sediminis]|uniref:ATP-binding cassette domain-containing protein n=1 Tax=Methanolobus sediminis TaxID=3072978 RepID=A0AA51UIF9_9EURY|nr:ATP-binding cassette domain-containing protein [Methanolobus sediminis]WMW23989.1 ATP-binding cassette domain-containing protein [Methanolobus sediminis]
MSVEVKDVSFFYNKGTSLEKKALDKVSFSIDKGEFILITGEVGSGKSTLIRHLNGILKPHSGFVKINGINSTNKKLRSKIGLLMQYPQRQLFGRTVLEDVSFGPSNFGLKGDKLKERVNDSLILAGLSPDIADLSPFSLSGGQMRLVALAGVLSMRPEYLILDEPTSGLDPENRASLFSTLKKLHGSGISVIVVSHQIDDFLPFVDKVLLLKDGCVDFIGSPEEYLLSVSSPVPEITSMMRELQECGFEVAGDVYSVDDAFNEIARTLGSDEGHENE